MLKSKFGLILVLLAAGSVADAQSLSNAGFECWQSPVMPQGSIIEQPTGWGTSDWALPNMNLYGGPFTPVNQVTKSCVVKHSGTAAVKIQTKDAGTLLGVVPGVLSTATVGLDEGALEIATNFGHSPISIRESTFPFISADASGLPVNRRVEAVKAYVRLDPGNTDPSVIHVKATQSYDFMGMVTSVTVGEGIMVLQPGLATFTEVTIPLVYTDNNVIPEKLSINFISSYIAPGTSVFLGSLPIHAGNTLYVDDVQIVYSDSSSEGAYGIAGNQAPAGAAQIPAGTDMSGSIRSATDTKMGLPNQPIVGKISLESGLVSDGVRVYPNPVRESMYVKLNQEKVPALLTLWDLNGRKMTEMQSNKEETMLPVENLAPGIYLLQVNHNGILEQLKVVKQ